MEITKGIKTDIQNLVSQMTNDELDFVQTEILRIKEKRKRDELKQTISETNVLLTKLSVLVGDVITVNSWVDELANRVDVEISLLDLVESLKGLI